MQPPDACNGRLTRTVLIMQSSIRGSGDDCMSSVLLLIGGEGQHDMLM